MKLKRLLCYSLSEQVQIVIFFGLLLLAEGIRRWTPSGWQIRWLAQNDAEKSNLPRELLFERLRKALRLLEIADRQNGFGKGCVRKALALKVLTKMWRIPVEFKIGVSRGTKGLQAHGWLEWEGAKLEWFEEDSSVKFYPLAPANQKTTLE